MKRIGGGKNRWENYGNQKKKEESEVTNDAPKTFDENASYQMVIHTADNFEGADIVFNPDFFPNIHIFSKLVITDSKGTKFIVQVQKESFCQELKNKSYHLSVIKTLADNYTLDSDNSSRINVKLKVIEDISEFKLDIIEVHFKDQFVSRRDLYKLAKVISDNCVYTSKTVEVDNLRVKVINALSKEGNLVHSGVITFDTKFLFRTLSCRYIVLIEISKEMCQTNIVGELYMEKVLKILKALTQRMNALQTHHKITFLLFARLFYPQFADLASAKAKALEIQRQNSSAENFTSNFSFQIDHHGKVFQDVYHRIVLKEVNKDWEICTEKVKSTIFQFLNYINLKPDPKQPLIEIARMKANNSTTTSTPIPETPEEDGLGFNFEEEETFTNTPDELKKNCIPIECELANSEYSNFPQALSLLISANNSSHKLSRSLTTTGTTALIFTAGEAKYNTEYNFARMLKEYLLLGRIYCNLLVVRDDVKASHPTFVYHSSELNTYAEVDELEIQTYFNDETKEEIQIENRRLVSTNSYEKLQYGPDDFSSSKKECDYIHNYLQISDVVTDDSKKSEQKVKSVYWINLIKGFTPEVLNSHSQLFQFSKTNPDPFLSLSIKCKRVYQPSSSVETYVNELAKHKMAFSPDLKADNHFQNIMNKIKENRIDVKAGSSTDQIRKQFNKFDKDVFKTEKERDAPAPNYEQMSIPSGMSASVLLQDQDAGSFGKKNDVGSFGKRIVKPRTGSINSGYDLAAYFRKTPDYRGSVNVTGAELANYGQYNMKNMSGELKKASHFRKRWSRIEDASKLNSVVRNTNRRMLELPQEVQEFEDIWKNLTQPPLLPLATYFFPKVENLNITEKYVKHQYNVNLQGSIKQNMEEFIDELVGHRIALEFQLIDQESIDEFGNDTTQTDLYKKKFRLSWGNHHHYVTEFNENLIIRTYYKKKLRTIGAIEKETNFFPIYYKYLIFNERIQGLVGKRVIFEGEHQINWNKFDIHVASTLKEKNLDLESYKELISYKTKLIPLILIASNKTSLTKEMRIARFKKLLQNIEDKLAQFGFKTTIACRVQDSILDNQHEKIKKYHIKVFLGGQASGFGHFFFQYDETYCPDSIYHMTLSWFTCSGNVIAEFIRALYGFAKLTDFVLKSSPSNNNFKIIAGPFESNLKINFKAEYRNELIAILQKAPYNFIIDSIEANNLCLIHESACVMLYLHQDYIVWRENRFADLNIQIMIETDDAVTICRDLFRKLLLCIFSFDIITEILGNLPERNLSVKNELEL